MMTDTINATALVDLVDDLRREAKQGSSNADYYSGKSWAYDDAADRLESILKANVPHHLPPPGAGAAGKQNVASPDTSNSKAGGG